MENGAAGRPRLPYAWMAIGLFMVVALPRLASLGYFPWLDDGYHAFMAQYIHNSVASGAGFPRDVTGFKLYPVLFSWAWALPGNAMLWLRLVDLFFALLAGWILCCLLIRESGSPAFGLALALACLCGLNHPGAVQSGFKNYFAPAFACLFLALYIARGAAPHSQRWLWAGALAALGVLFRETFFPFALLGCAALLRKPAALLRYVCGGIAGAAAVTAACALYRHQFRGIFEFYFTYGKIYGPEAARRLQKFLENGGRAAAIFSPMLALAAGAAIVARRRLCSGRALFWLCGALLPLAEPFAKIGFLYHFSVCLPGLAGFCACIYSGLEGARLRRYGQIAAVAALCAMLPPLFAQLPRAAVTWEVAKAYPAQGWPSHLASESTTIAAAEAVKRLLPDGGKTSATGFAYFIFPASQTLPAQIGLGDLSRMWIYSGMDERAFLRRLDEAPPDVVLIAHAEQDHSAIFERELKEVFDKDARYRLAAKIPADGRASYGWLGYSIYKLEDPKAAPVAQ